MADWPEYKESIDSWVDEHVDDMLEDLKMLVRIPSVRGEPEEGMPYGEMPARALAAMQGLMERYGFRTSNYDMRCVAGDLDAGNEKLLDILAHLDVVAVTDTWTKTQPFEPLIEDGKIYGRGTCDDKGPAVAALYAMRCVRELGLKLSGGVRLICGSDEECGSDDLRYYYSKEEEAPYTFSPDADYPLINIEKGRLSRTFRAAGGLGSVNGDGKEAKVISLHAGDTENIAPGRGTAVIEGISGDDLERAAREAAAEGGGEYSWVWDGNKAVITAKGESAHAASPEAGINSVTMLLSLLERLSLAEDEGVRLLRNIGNLWPHNCFSGEGLSVAMSDDISGPLTISLNILEYETDGAGFTLEGTFDCRAPLCGNDENLTEVIRAKLEEAGLEMEDGQMLPGHYVSEDSEIVRRLLESYELYFGKRGKPFAIGGGTYVHGLKRGVAFGCAVPETDNHMHGDDEFMDIDMLVKSTKIFADAIMRLCGEV